MDFAELLKRPEGKTLEFKRDLSSPDGALRTFVAFANTAGGTLLIGVEDATRHVRGVRDPLDVEERLASLISDSILPRLVPDLEILPWRRTHLVAVQVHPSSSRPHYLAREGLEGGVYVRVGSTNRRADRELIEELRRFARGEAYDEQAMPEQSWRSSGPASASRCTRHERDPSPSARRTKPSCTPWPAVRAFRPGRSPPRLTSPHAPPAHTW